MEETEKNDELEEQQPYVPRPKWQIWGARFLLVLFLVLIFMYYVNIARG